MGLFNALFKPCRRFKRDEYASITVEAVFVFPILIWGYFGMFMLFEAYRSASANIRAGYTISDMLSREVQVVDGNYLEGLNDIQDVLTQTNNPTILRATFVSYNANTDTHTLEGSYATAGKIKITPGNFQSKIVANLPPMPHTGWLIVVETWVEFNPFRSFKIKPVVAELDAGESSTWGPFVFENTTVIRPRFAAKMALNL